MRFVCLDGSKVDLNLRQSNYPRKDKTSCKSTLQYECGAALDLIYPRHIILEEFTIPNTRLKIDFYIPSVCLAVEVQGAQHYRFNNFFYDTMQDFVNAKKRDVNKYKWCELNDIILVYVERPEHVGPRIKDAINKA